MKQSRFILSLFSIAITAILLMSGPANAQGTTSSIRVVVTNESGAAIGDLPIEITHMPTGRIRTTNTSSSGVATARGLAVGGPYEVTIAGGDYAADVQQGIFLSLDETEVIEITARSVIEGKSVV